MLYHRHYRHPAEDKIAVVDERQLNGGLIHSPVRLVAILHRIAMGQTLPEIKAELPTIPTNSLLHARAYFASQYPDLYKPHYPNEFKVLVDENIDPHFATDGARRAFGEAAHVSFHDLSKQTDLEVWKYACANKFNMIVTKDRAVVPSRKHIDLTRCAELKWKWRLQVNNGNVDTYLRQLPRIAHIRNASASGREIAVMLMTQKENIAEIYEEAVSPNIEISSNGVTSGKDYLEILYGRRNAKLESRISMHTDIILEEMELEHLDKNKRKRIRETVRNLVKLRMGGDFSKIPFRHDEKVALCEKLTLSFDVEQVERPCHHVGSFRELVRRERALVAA